MNSWYDEHLETFIRPNLGFIPSVDVKRCRFIQHFDKKMIHALCGVWKEAKKLAKGKQILLAGRDVFLFELLARLEGFPSIFRSDISAETARYVKEDYTSCFLLDTGYMGSVPRALNIKDFRLISYRPYTLITPELREDREKHQVFPHMRLSAYGKPYPVLHSVASNLEVISKYWTKATYTPSGQPGKDGTIQQRVYEPSFFEPAAIMTIHVAKHLPAPYRPKLRTILSMGRGI